jgi:hypothetical protein
MDNLEAIDEAFEAVRLCHIEQGKWCSWTFDIGVTYFMEAGYTKENSESIMEGIGDLLKINESGVAQRDVDDIDDHEIYTLISERTSL